MGTDAERASDTQPEGPAAAEVAAPSAGDGPNRAAAPARARTPRGPLGWLVLCLIAPGLWLERSRGIGRLALVLFYALVLSAAGVLLYRAASLNGLPDIGDPVDVAALERTAIPPERNAFVTYEWACKQYLSAPFADVADLASAVEPGWASIHPGIKSWHEMNRAGLDVWEDGTTRPDAFDPALLRPEDAAHPTVRILRGYAYLALLEASRLLEADDPNGAWRWYRAALRSSRHLATRSPWEARLVSIEIHEAACTAARAWAKHPQTTTAQLRAAIADVQQLDARTPKNAQTLGAEYAKLSHIVGDIPHWVERIRTVTAEDQAEIPYQAKIERFLSNEPERSRRVLRLIFANWLAECDRPAIARPKPETTGPDLFVDPKAPPNSQIVPPAALRAWLASSELSKIDLPPFEHCETALNERRTRAGLIVFCAEQAFLRDTKQMPRGPSDLLGLYLNQIPEGFEPGPDDFLPIPTTGDVP